MQSALCVFADKGYDRATIKDIATASGLAPSLLYHYFPSKQALLQALFLASGAQVMAAFARADAVGDPRERLGVLVRESASLVRENLDFWKLSWGVRHQPAVLGALAEGVAASSALYHARFADLLGQLGAADPSTEARLLFAAMDGVFQHFVQAPDTYPLDAVLDRLIALHTPHTERP